MTKNKRICVTFSSKGLRQHVTKLAEGMDMSESKTIELLVAQGIKSLTNKSAEPMSFNGGGDNNALLAMHTNAITRCSIRIANLNTPLTENNELKKAHELYFSTNAHSSTVHLCVEVSYFDFFDFKTKKVNERRVKEIILSECQLKNIGNTFTSPLHSSFHPELTLIFLTRADITFDIREYENPSPGLAALIGIDVTNDIVLLNVTLRFTSIPVFLNKRVNTIHSYLDYEKISYKTHRYIVREGWDTRRYSHLFHIDDIGSTRGGSYFIGVLHNQSTFDISNARECGFISIGKAQDRDMEIVEKFAKFFIAGIDMKISKSSLKKRKDSEDMRKLKQKLNNPTE